MRKTIGRKSSPEVQAAWMLAMTYNRDWGIILSYDVRRLIAMDEISRRVVLEVTDPAEGTTDWMKPFRATKKPSVGLMALSERARKGRLA